MIVTRIQDLLDTERDVQGGAWASRRFLIASDNVGFSLTETTIEPGADLTLWYKHHIEANYVIEGTGEVESAETGEIFPIAAGTTYTLDKNDKHYLRAFTRLKLVCVFSPALTGTEVHDKDGAYTLPE